MRRALRDLRAPVARHGRSEAPLPVRAAVSETPLWTSTLLAERHLQHAMLAGVQGYGDARGRLKLNAMPLTIVKGKTVAVEPCVTGNGQRGGRVKTAGKQDNGASAGGCTWCAHGGN